MLIFANNNGFVAQLYRAPHYGCGGLRLESLRGHKGRVKNRAKAMVDHLPFLLSQSSFLIYLLGFSAWCNPHGVTERVYLGTFFI